MSYVVVNSKTFKKMLNTWLKEISIVRTYNQGSMPDNITCTGYEDVIWFKTSEPFFRIHDKKQFIYLKPQCGILSGLKDLFPKLGTFWTSFRVFYI